MFIKLDCTKFSFYFKQFGSSMSTFMDPSSNVLLAAAEVLSLNIHSLKIKCLKISFFSSYERKYTYKGRSSAF